MRTEWTPLLREFQPRFSEDSEIELPSIKPNLLPDNSELKVSFSFDHDHYVTEWISIASGNGKFLNSLRFFLTYSGDHITDVSWKLVRPHASRLVSRACASPFVPFVPFDLCCPCVLLAIPARSTMTNLFTTVSGRRRFGLSTPGFLQPSWTTRQVRLLTPRIALHCTDLI